MDRIAVPNMLPDFAEIVPPPLHIDVLRAGHATILVEVQHRTFPTTGLKLPSKPDEAHRPTAYWRRPISNLQDSLQVIVSVYKIKSSTFVPGLERLQALD